MNYQQTLSYIHSLGMFSLPAGTERIKRALDILGNPQLQFKSIHVAGTNGKGSVCTMTAAVLKTAGYKTGLFISPYIINFRERISVNDEFISEKDLCRLSERVINTSVRLTEFEFITAVGFLYFAEQYCDIAVIETGLGGRFDATNVIPAPISSVITKIGFDHTAILGDTIEKIAFEKCGIIKNNITVSSPNQSTEAKAIIVEKSRKLIIPDLKALSVTSSTIDGNDFIYKNKKYQIRLAGKFQIFNAITAIEVLLNCGLKISDDALKKGMKNAFIPARLEVISKNPLVVLDGAHNPDGADVISEFMRRFNGKAYAVVGMMKDKDYKSFLKKTLPFCQGAIAVRATEQERALSLNEMYFAAKEFCDNTVAAENHFQAIEIIKSLPSDIPVFIFGSLYLASAIRQLLINAYI